MLQKEDKGQVSRSAITCVAWMPMYWLKCFHCKSDIPALNVVAQRVLPFLGMKYEIMSPICNKSISFSWCNFTTRDRKIVIILSHLLVYFLERCIFRCACLCRRRVPLLTIAESNLWRPFMSSCSCFYSSRDFFPLGNSWQGRLYMPWQNGGRHRINGSFFWFGFAIENNIGWNEIENVNLLCCVVTFQQPCGSIYFVWFYCLSLALVSQHISIDRFFLLCVGRTLWTRQMTIQIENVNDVNVIISIVTQMTVFDNALIGWYGIDEKGETTVGACIAVNVNESCLIRLMCFQNDNDDGHNCLSVSGGYSIWFSTYKLNRMRADLRRISKWEQRFIWLYAGVRLSLRKDLWINISPIQFSALYLCVQTACVRACNQYVLQINGDTLLASVSPSCVVTLCAMRWSRCYQHYTLWCKHVKAAANCWTLIRDKAMKAFNERVRARCCSLTGCCYHHSHCHSNDTQLEWYIHRFTMPWKCSQLWLWPMTQSAFDKTSIVRWVNRFASLENRLKFNLNLARRKCRSIESMQCFNLCMAFLRTMAGWILSSFNVHYTTQIDSVYGHLGDRPFARTECPA